MINIILSVLMSMMALGEDPKPADDQLAKRKEEALQHLETRIKNLSEAKTCISAAQDKEALKKCHEGLKEDRMVMKKEMMEKRMGRMQDRMKKMEHAPGHSHGATESK